MGDLLDGDGEIITDGDGASLFDGDGGSSSAVSATTSLDPFIERIQREIKAPDYVIFPFLYEVIKDFTERTWVLYRSYQVQGSGALASVNKSISFNTVETVPGLIPMELHRLKSAGSEYKPLRQEIVGAVDEGTYEVRGAKFYNFYATDDELFETYIRVFPWSVDAPVLLLGIAFKTVDEPTSVPRVLLDYKEEICHGVMGRMRMVPGTKWSDPNFSGFNESKYEKGIGKAKLRWFNNNSSSMVLGRRGFI